MFYRRISSLLRVLYRQIKVEGFKSHLSAILTADSSVGRFSKLHGNAKLIHSTLGDYSYVGPNATVGNCDIGKFCSIAPEALVGGLGMHPVDRVSTHPVFYTLPGPLGGSFADKAYIEEHKRTKVGNDVWIGARAIVLDGVIIGDGAIIAAGAVVTKDVSPYEIVGGVPAQFIRKRFDDIDASRLLELAWWDWSDDMLQKHAKKIRSKNLEDIFN